MDKRNRLPAVLEPKEAKNLLEIPNKRYPTGLRNIAILSTMLNMGLRVSEVAGLKSENVSLTECSLKIVNGISYRDRDLVIPSYTVDILKQWEKRRIECNYFFSTLKGTKLSTRYIQAMVRRYAEKAKIDKNVTPHTLRHTFATEFYRQSKDIEMLRRILGLSSINVTQTYIALSNMSTENKIKEFKEFF